MKIVDIQESKIASFVEKKRPPVEMRDKLDVGYRFENNVVEIFTIRPRWDNKEEKLESSVAKAKYISSKRVWKVYWMRSNLKWYAYDPRPEVYTLEEFIELIDRDIHHCFWG